MSKPYVLGVDIGGTNTVFGIVDARGQVIASDSIKTRKHANFDDYVAELHDGVMHLLKVNDAEDKIYGIGIMATITQARFRIRQTFPGGPLFRLLKRLARLLTAFLLQSLTTPTRPLWEK